ncbi:MAG TPA: hypothetical protein VKY27_04580 [Bacteriovoracaceae bacterium]|nr:hypothetical protein [Bacteriovoracaceae bacterium]
MYSAKDIHLNSVFDLYHLLDERKVEKNFQDGTKLGGALHKQVAVNLITKNGIKIIDGHFYIKGVHKFRFDISILDLTRKKFSLTIYKKNVLPSEMALIYDEIVNLKNQVIIRNAQGGGPKKEHIKTELYLQSGRVKTPHSKMRFVQAYIDGKYPNDLLMIYKSMNFKIVGKGEYPELKNWESEAQRLGIIF